MKIAPRCALAATLAAVACMDSAPSAPDAVPLKTPASSAPVTTAVNAACTVHWASGVGGSWFDATKWNPAGVPTSASSVCVDAPGTYLVTLDPTTDATPIDVLALTIGGTGATPTLRLSGLEVTLNVAQGIDIQTNATFDMRTTTVSRVTAQQPVNNLGTLSMIAVCGGCGNAAMLNADVINKGTWNSTGFLTLSKTNGVYQNTGTISISQAEGILVPAGAGNVSFTQDAGTIGGAGNFSTLVIRSGTFTMNGGKARQRIAGNLKPVVVVDGATLAIAATATDSAALGLLGSSTAAATVTGDIPALTSLWLGAAPSGQPATITFAGNPKNAGRLVIVKQLDTFGGELTLAGTGRLTNTGTIDQSLNSGTLAVFHYALEVTNNGSWLVTSGTSAALEKASGSYINTGSIDQNSTAGVSTVRAVGSTLTNTGTITGGTVVVDGGRLVATGNSQTHLKSLNGGVIEPGNTLGTFTSYTFLPTATGTLRIELGGTTPGTEYDRLNATQSAFLAGTLAIVEANGFQAGKCGQQFDVVTHSVPSGYGSFASVTGLNPGPGRMLRVVYIGATATTKGVVRLIGFDGAQKICVGPNPVSIAEGGSGAQYAIALDHAPTATVTVTPTPTAQVTVTPASLSFTTSNWQMPQFFTVTAVDDNAQEGAHTGTVTHAVTTTDATYQGFVPAALTANIADNDTNLPPVAVNDGATTAEDTPVTVSVLGNDSDPEGKPLTVTAVGAPANGTSQVSGGGTTVTYTPKANFNGPDSFSYTVSDGSLTKTATVSINVTAVVDPPVAVNDQGSVRTRRVVVVSVLANDTDPDGGSLTVTQVSTPTRGTATITGAGQTVTYQSQAGYIGPDQFTYTITNSAGARGTATVSVNVTDPALNAAPIALPDVAQLVRAPGTVRIAVLDNDSDPDGDAFALVSVTQPSVGSATITGRSIVYAVLNPNVSGSTSFTYTIRDALGATATATVTITLPVAVTRIDYQMVVLDGLALIAGGRTSGLPETLFMSVSAAVRSTPFSETPFIVEFTVPAGAFGVGRMQGRGNGRNLVPDPNCTIIYSGGTPIRYRCVVPGRQSNQIAEFAFPPTTTSTAIVMTVYPQEPVEDPNMGNNSLTLNFPSDCVIQPDGITRCRKTN